MKQWLVLFQKEMVECARNYKWIWIPLVFAVLGVIQPVMMYFLPDILEMSGSLPEGTIIQFPEPTAGQVMADTLGDFLTLGLLVLVLAFMGTIAAERAGGVAGMVLVKRVSFTSYVTAKWAAAALMTVAASVTGMLSAWYYTGQLIGPVPGAALAAGTFLMIVGLLLPVTLTVALSAALRSTGTIAFVTLLLTAVFSVVTSQFGSKMTWSPGKLGDYAAAAFTQGGWPDGIWPAVACSFICIAALLIAAVVIFRRKELVG
jgi:ABC-2 type transport system permease protein